DDIERTGLRSEDRTTIEPSDDERTNAEGIAGADEFLVGEPDERIGALELPQALDEPVDEAVAPCAGHQMQNDFRIGCRLHDGAFAHKLAAKGQAVGEVAVVADGKATALEFDE